MGTESDFETRVETVTTILARQYEQIDEANAIIEQHKRRAGAYCGPVSQARFLVQRAELAIGSAENIIDFFAEVATSSPDGDFYPNVAKAAIAEVAKRRSQKQSGAVVA